MTETLSEYIARRSGQKLVDPREEELTTLRAENASLRERRAAVEKAFADAEQDRFADIQTALAQERARVEAEFQRLIELATPLGATLKEIVAVRERLMGDETRKPWRARKVGGSYQYTGTVVAEFLTTTKQPRIVLEFDAPVQGLLHIFNRNQVEEIEGGGSFPDKN